MPPNKRNAERSFGGRSTQATTVEQFAAQGYGDFAALAQQSVFTVDADGLIDFGNFTISKIGVEGVAERTTETQWWDLIKRLLRLNERTQVIVGDLLLIGEQRWGRTYELVAAETGYSKKTLRNCRYVMDKVQLSRRRDNLTFGHYASVASLLPDAQAHWLEQASADEWSVKQLREEVRRVLPAKAANQSPKGWERIEHAILKTKGIDKHDLAERLRALADQLENSD